MGTALKEDNGNKARKVRPDVSRKRVRANVLIVEDEPLNRQVMSRYIGLMNYRVFTADSGSEALELIRVKPVDLVVLDYKLPDMTGIDLCRLIREDNLDVPVVLTSAYDVPEEKIREARNMGMYGFLQKPFAFRHLKKVLRVALRETSFTFLRKKFYQRNGGNYSLNSKVLATRIFKTIFREGLDRNGHVHFHIRGHKDHIILLCNRKHLGKVIAKGANCRSGECIRWRDSEFAALSPDQVFKDLKDDITRVRIDVSGYKMSWPTMADFICWLELSY